MLLKKIVVNTTKEKEFFIIKIFFESLSIT